MYNNNLIKYFPSVVIIAKVQNNKQMVFSDIIKIIQKNNLKKII
jgi:hypothetical protein